MGEFVNVSGKILEIKPAPADKGTNRIAIPRQFGHTVKAPTEVSLDASAPRKSVLKDVGNIVVLTVGSGAGFAGLVFLGSLFAK